MRVLSMFIFASIFSTSALALDPGECFECNPSDITVKDFGLQDNGTIFAIDEAHQYYELSGNWPNGDFSLADPNEFRMSFVEGGGDSPSFGCGLLDEFQMRNEIACFGINTDKDGNPSNEWNIPPAGTYSMLDVNAVGYAGSCAISDVDGSVVSWGHQYNDAVGDEPTNTGFTTCTAASGGIQCAAGRVNSGIECYGDTSKLNIAAPTSGTYIDVDCISTKYCMGVLDDNTVTYFGDDTVGAWTRFSTRLPSTVAVAQIAFSTGSSGQAVLDTDGYAHIWSKASGSHEIVMEAPISYNDAYNKLHGTANDNGYMKTNVKFAIGSLKHEGNNNICGIVAELPTETVVSLDNYTTTDEVDDITVGGLMCWGSHEDNDQAIMITSPCE